MVTREDIIQRDLDAIQSGIAQDEFQPLADLANTILNPSPRITADQMGIIYNQYNSGALSVEVEIPGINPLTARAGAIKLADTESVLTNDMVNFLASDEAKAFFQGIDTEITVDTIDATLVSLDAAAESAGLSDNGVALLATAFESYIQDEIADTRALEEPNPTPTAAEADADEVPAQERGDDSVTSLTGDFVTAADGTTNIVLTPPSIYEYFQNETASWSYHNDFESIIDLRETSLQNIAFTLYQAGALKIPSIGEPPAPMNPSQWWDAHKDDIQHPSDILGYVTPESQLQNLSDLKTSLPQLTPVIDTIDTIDAFFALEDQYQERDDGYIISFGPGETRDRLTAERTEFVFENAVYDPSTGQTYRVADYIIQNDLNDELSPIRHYDFDLLESSDFTSTQTYKGDVLAYYQEAGLLPETEQPYPSKAEVLLRIYSDFDLVTAENPVPQELLTAYTDLNLSGRLSYRPEILQGENTDTVRRNPEDIAQAVISDLDRPETNELLIRAYFTLYPTDPNTGTVALDFERYLQEVVGVDDISELTAVTSTAEDPEAIPQHVSEFLAAIRTDAASEEPNYELLTSGLASISGQNIPPSIIANIMGVANGTIEADGEDGATFAEAGVLQLLNASRAGQDLDPISPDDVDETVLSSLEEKSDEEIVLFLMSLDPETPRSDVIETLSAVAAANSFVPENPAGTIQDFSDRVDEVHGLSLEQLAALGISPEDAAGMSRIQFEQTISAIKANRSQPAAGAEDFDLSEMFNMPIIGNVIQQTLLDPEKIPGYIEAGENFNVSIDETNQTDFKNAALGFAMNPSSGMVISRGVIDQFQDRILAQFNDDPGSLINALEDETLNSILDQVNGNIAIHTGPPLDKDGLIQKLREDEGFRTLIITQLRQDQELKRLFDNMTMHAIAGGISQVSGMLPIGGLMTWLEDILQSFGIDIDLDGSDALVQTNDEPDDSDPSNDDPEGPENDAPDAADTSAPAAESPPPPPPPPMT